MAERALHEPFHEVARQREADRLGMLTFLASEVMLFGGLFAGALALRLLHPGGYADAAGHLDIVLGTVNTAVLLTSSLFAALGVAAARMRRPRVAGTALAGAIALGTLFLGIKGYEYWQEYHEGLMPGTGAAHFETRAEQLFMNLYFAATALHAVHVAVGLMLLAVVALNRQARNDAEALLIGNAALYWHIVDIVWVFLYPTLYLPGAA